MLTGALDFDDVVGLTDADVDGYLRASAGAGAQVRAVAAALAEGVLAPLAQLRPRAVVVVVGRGPAGHAAAMVIATTATHVDVPLVAAPAVPIWIGPLDVVVVLGDDAGDPRLADAAGRAVRRRAELVVAGPLEGPLRDAAAGAAMDLSPRVVVPPPFRFVGHVAALLAVLTALTEIRSTGAEIDLTTLADRLDDEAAAAHPDNEVFHNPAKSLAARVADRPLVWAGDTPAATVLAAHAARVSHAVAGTVSVGCGLAEAITGSMARGHQATNPVDSIFYDPDIDGPPSATPARVQVITTPTWEWSVRQRMSVLVDAETVIASDSTAFDASSPGRRGPTIGVGRPDGSGSVDTPADLEPLLVVAVRIEMAAVYLRLVGAH